jgi:hypothetical protein
MREEGMGRASVRMSNLSCAGISSIDAARGLI